MNAFSKKIYMNLHSSRYPELNVFKLQTIKEKDTELKISSKPIMVDRFRSDLLTNKKIN